MSCQIKKRQIHFKRMSHFLPVIESYILLIKYTVCLLYSKIKILKICAFCHIAVNHYKISLTCFNIILMQ